MKHNNIMKTQPVLLDLFCGAGGCGKGYSDAGFEVVGIDIEPQPRYPFPFIQGCAIELLKCLLSGGRFRPSNNRHVYLEDVDVIHASPPCQGYSENMKHLSRPTQMLIEPCRELLTKSSKPWIIENVEGAPLATETTLFGDNGVMLCGTQFGLRIWRHRLFETSFPMASPGPCRHTKPPLNPHREESRQRMRQEFGQVDLEKIWRDEAGVPWMDNDSGRQAIPPVFTKFIGTQTLMTLVRGE